MNTSIQKHTKRETNSSEEDIRFLKTNISKYLEEVKFLKQELAKLKEDHNEEIKELKIEFQKINENQKSKKKEKEELREEFLPKEQIKHFRCKLMNFYYQAQKIAKEFEEEGENSLQKLKKETFLLAETYEEIEFKVAIELAHLVEHGGLQSMKDERIWRSHNLGYYNVSQEAKNVLSNATFNTAQLKTLFQLLQIGLPKSKNKKSLEDALIQELSMRANTR